MAGHEKEKAGEKLIATNPIAYSNYHITEVVEAGMVLTGTEIKSMRAQSPNLRDGFVEVNSHGKGQLEAWLVNVYIGPYSHGNIWNHEGLRRRKLLLHRHQIDRIHSALIKESANCIPIKIYLKKGRAKIEIAIGKGKKKYDKRQDLKKKSADREMEQALKKSR